MVFFVCPVFRKVRRPASPSDFARSYQYSQTDEETTARENARETLPEANSSLSQDLKQVSESFSHRLRRRFSRETKLPGEPGRFLFPFSRKASRSHAPAAGPGLTALGDVGSSLMNERGYDSDAQCIATPKHVDRLDGSPAVRGFGRLDLSDLIEQSHERTGSEFGTGGGDSDVSETCESAFGMCFIPTPQGSLRGPQSTIHMPRAADDEGTQPWASLENEQIRAVSEAKTDFARSLPTLSLVSHDERGPPDPEPFPSIEVPVGVNGQNLMADWIQFLRTNHQNNGTASSSSLPKQSANIVVPKRRPPATPRRSFTETRSVHLGELGIPHMLAAPSMSSGTLSGNPSIAELARKDRYGMLRASSQENIHTRQRPGASAVLGSETQKQAVPHRRDVSSFYSRQSSILSADASTDAQSVTIHAANAIGNKPDGRDKQTGERATVGNGPDSRTESLKSKFVERFDSGNSEARQVCAASNDTGELVSPRKISIGWMSGGRRVGYGYTLVTQAEGESQQPLEKDSPHGNQMPDRQAGAGTNDITKLVEGSRSAEPRKGNGELSTPSAPEYDSITVTDHPRCLSEASTLLQSRNTIQSINENPVQGSLWTKLRNRPSRDHNGPALAADDLARAPRSEGKQVVQYSNLINNASDTFASHKAQRSRFTNIRPRPRKDREDAHRGRKTWVLGASRTEKGPDISVSTEQAEHIQPEDLTANHDGKSADKTRGSPSGNSRSGRWALRFSRHRESKRLSSSYPKAPSETSSGPYHDCASNGLDRADSVRSNVAEDLASIYRECLQMPGSFEGSQWASRTSRMM